MRRVRGHDGCGARSEPALLTVDHQHDVPVDHVPNFFLNVVVLVELDRVGLDVPVREGHVLRMEEPSAPSMKRGTLEHLALVDEGHEARLLRMHAGQP